MGSGGLSVSAAQGEQSAEVHAAATGRDDREELLALRNEVERNHQWALAAEQAAKKNYEHALAAERAAKENYDRALSAEESAKQNYERALSAERAAKENYDRALSTEESARQNYDRALAAERMFGRWTERHQAYAEVGRQDANQWSMGPQEAAFIANLLHAVRARRVVEIGTHVGMSALYICHALREIGWPDAVLHTFEITDRAERACRNLERFGYEKMAHVHQVSSHGPEAIPIREAVSPIDVVLVDGDHSFKGSYADFCFWVPAVRPGGFLIFHDISEEFEREYLRNGSRSVFTTLKRIEARHPGYEIIRMIPPHYHNTTSMAIVQKRAESDAPATRVGSASSLRRFVSSFFGRRPAEGGWHE